MRFVALIIIGLLMSSIGVFAASNLKSVRSNDGKNFGASNDKKLDKMDKKSGILDKKKIGATDKKKSGASDDKNMGTREGKKVAMAKVIGKGMGEKNAKSASPSNSDTFKSARDAQDSKRKAALLQNERYATKVSGSFAVR